MIQTLAVAVLGYLIGSVSFARIVAGRVLPDQDISRTEMVLPGASHATVEYTGVSATSVGARLGPRWGGMVGLLDILKGFLPTLAVQLLWPTSLDHLVIAVMIVVGHNWPVWHRFRGGRGQSSLIGSLLAIDWLAPIVCLPLGALLGLVLVRDMMVAYFLGQLLLIGWFWLFGTPAEIIYAVIINLLIAIPSVPEFMAYARMRRSGQIAQISNWRDVLRAHPAMGSNRYRSRQEPREPS